MTTKDAIQILKAHNEWRRDRESEMPQPMPYTPKELGEAIDVAIAKLDRFEDAKEVLVYRGDYYLNEDVPNIDLKHIGNQKTHTLYAIPKEQNNESA